MTNSKQADLLDFNRDNDRRYSEGANVPHNKDAMARLHKRVIRATDIAAQFWCEKQMELSYLYGRKESAEMRSGSAAHKEIESIINVPVKLKPKSYADSLYKNLYSSYIAVHTLPERGVAREISIYGSANGFKLAGKIDEIRMESGSFYIYEDKTKKSDQEPTEAQLASHRVQVELYVKMVNEIRSGVYGFDNFLNSYNIAGMELTSEFEHQLEEMEIEEEARSIEGIVRMYFSSIKDSGAVAKKAYLRYLNSITGNIIKIYSVDYDEKVFAEKLKYAMAYWRGEREALPVPESEKWKCNYCPFFGKQCVVWYTEKQRVL
ncbi:MAG: PD-(D/E)XK nuclease family protein [Candidatus Micrarchaeaceae archaeon]